MYLRPPAVAVQHYPSPVYCKYNARTGSAVYLIVNAKRGLKDYLNYFSFASTEMTLLHPMAIHLAIMYDNIHSTSTEHEQFIISLNAIEKQLLTGSPVASHTELSIAEGYYSKYTQSLHLLSRQMIIEDNCTGRSTATLTRLIKDTEKILQETEKLRDTQQIDIERLERVRDGLLCLEDFCIDRARRLQNRKQRVQNLIALIYNLTANKDSITNLKIASESTEIARETRKDSVAMKTIAFLTMLYLPATFVCSLFGTNFFALDISADHSTTLLVSKLWWVYVVVSLSLTLLTLLCWIWWLKGRARKPRARKLNYD